MTDRQAIETLLEEFYAARVCGDVDTVGKLFADNATFQIAGSDQASPMPALLRGKPDIVKLMQGMSPISSSAISPCSRC
jgi:hypothetical protein